MEDQTQEIDRIDDETAPVEAEAENQGNGGGEDEPSETLDASDEGAQPEPEKTVPYQALHEEREKRKKAAEENALLQQRFQELAERLAQPPAPPKAEPEIVVPDKDEDFGGYLAYQLETLTQAQKAQAEQLQQQRKAQQQQQAAQALMARVSAETKAFREATPDFDQAYAHVRQSRASQLAIQGVPQHLINDQITREELDFANNAQARGQNAPELLYEYAKTLGYAPAQQTTQASPEPRTKKTPPKSLSGMPGKPTAGKLTADKLLSMPESEYHALLAQDPDKIRAIMRGTA